MDHHGQRTIASNWRPEGGPSCFAAERRAAPGDDENYFYAITL